MQYFAHLDKRMLWITIRIKVCDHLILLFPPNSSHFPLTPSLMKEFVDVALDPLPRKPKAIADSTDP